MTQQEIIEGNKLIAEFMGLRFLGQGYDFYSEPKFNFIFINTASDDPKESHILYPSNMLFHSSWDWLMLVVDKIERLNIPIRPLLNDGFTVSIFDNITTIKNIVNPRNFEDEQKSPYHYDTIHTGGKSKIESTYKAVLQFIKWYNQTQLK